MKKNHPQISIKIFSKNQQLVEILRSCKTKRIFKYIQKEKFSDCLFEVSIRYDRNFKNETPKQNLNKSMEALKIFLEK